MIQIAMQCAAREMWEGLYNLNNVVILITTESLFTKFSPRGKKQMHFRCGHSATVPRAVSDASN